MLYDDKALQSGKTAQHRWRGFNQDQVFKSSIATGGVFMEGIFQLQEKHYVEDAERKQHRYRALHVEFSHGQRRRYDHFGTEIESNLVSTKKMNTGYLNSSYKQTESGGEDVLTYKDAAELLRTGTDIDTWSTPKHSHCLVLWSSEDAIKDVEIEFGQRVRVRTRGNGPLIESITVLDTDEKRSVASYSGGEKVGGSWTDKLMAAKQTREGTPECDQNEGVADDEWGD